MRFCLFGVLSALAAVCSGCQAPSELPGGSADAGRTVLYRDSWGVPHIYAPSEPDGAYAMGWAQAEDRPEELLKNFLRGMGEISSVEGESGLQSDMVALMWDHYGVAKRNLDRLSQPVRDSLQAFAAGVNDYYSARGEDVPEWWRGRRADEAMVVAFGRMFLYSWSIDDGYGDLLRSGVRPPAAGAQRGSNQFAVAPSRSAQAVPILAIDPHLSWWGASRFWEFRIRAGALRGSGFTLPGFPTIGLGHNENLAWAMTTGGPDTADVYELKLNGEDSYWFDGRPRPLEIRRLSIRVKGEPEPRTFDVPFSHHGPVVAVQNGKAYALRTAYAEEVGILDAWRELNLGKDVGSVETALASLQLFPQNVMAADTAGNIYYQRTGRTPMRPDGFDWSRAVDGSTSATEWRGLHPSSDLVQLLNPSHGYMQNCNIPPDAMMVNSPLRPELYPPEVFSDRGHGPLGGWSNPRGARALQLLSEDDSVTAEEAIGYVLDIRPYGVQRWIAYLLEAESRLEADPDLSATLDEIRDWDGRLAKDSQAALKYYLWRLELSKILTGAELSSLSNRLDDILASTGRPSAPLNFQESELAAALRAWRLALDRLRAELSVDAVYGDVFRVGRGERSWPVGGGGHSLLGTATLRSVGFGPARDDGTRWGQWGQTATQIVALSQPIQSWTAVPVGQSDRPDSPHYDDQAQKLFSPRALKPSWWLPEQLAPHVRSRTVLK